MVDVLESCVYPARPTSYPKDYYSPVIFAREKHKSYSSSRDLDVQIAPSWIPSRRRNILDLFAVPKIVLPSDGIRDPYIWQWRLLEAPEGNDD